MRLLSNVAVKPALRRWFSTSKADKDIEHILNRIELTSPPSQYFTDFSLFASTPVRRCVVTNRLLPESMLLRFTCEHTLSGMSFLQHDVSHHGTLPAAYVYASKSTLYHPSLTRFIDSSRLFGSPSPQIKSQFQNRVVQDVYNECLRLLVESCKLTPNAVHINPTPKGINEDLQRFMMRAEMQSIAGQKCGARPKQHKFLVLLKQKNTQNTSELEEGLGGRVNMLTWFQHNVLPLYLHDAKRCGNSDLEKVVTPALPLSFPPDAKWYKGPLAFWRWGKDGEMPANHIKSEKKDVKSKNLNPCGKEVHVSSKQNSKNLLTEAKTEKIRPKGNEEEGLSPDIIKFLQNCSLPIHFSESYRDCILRNPDLDKGEDSESLRHSSLAKWSQFESVPIIYALEPLLLSAHVKAALKPTPMATGDEITHLTLEPTPINNRLMSFLFKLRLLSLG